MRQDRKAVSPAISTVIITAVTIVLVLVTGTYATQVLERQRGASEFETVQKTIATFDDALRDVAWKRDSSRSTRFTVKYGQLILYSNLSLRVNVTDYPSASYSTVTGFVQYAISTQYITYGDGYESYLLGDNNTLATSSTQSSGQCVVRQAGSWLNITLDYRVRALKTYTTTVNGTTVSYVDIWIIKVKVPHPSAYVNDFDLTARSLNIAAITFAGAGGNGYAVTGGKCDVKVDLGSYSNTSSIALDGDKVVFNFLIAEVQVSM